VTVDRITPYQEIDRLLTHAASKAHHLAHA
jgi:hypothetical protein